MMIKWKIFYNNYCEFCIVDFLNINFKLLKIWSSFNNNCYIIWNIIKMCYFIYWYWNYCKIKEVREIISFWWIFVIFYKVRYVYNVLLYFYCSFIKYSLIFLLFFLWFVVSNLIMNNYVKILGKVMFLVCFFFVGLLLV